MSQPIHTKKSAHTSDARSSCVQAGRRSARRLSVDVTPRSLASVRASSSLVVFRVRMTSCQRLKKSPSDRSGQSGESSQSTAMGKDKE